MRVVLFLGLGFGVVFRSGVVIIFFLSGGMFVRGLYCVGFLRCLSFCWGSCLKLTGGCFYRFQVDEVGN